MPKFPPSAIFARALRACAAFVLSPGFLLGLLLVGVFVYWHEVGYLAAHRHADSYSYVNASGHETLEQALADHRTAGYPLLIRWLRDETARTFARRFQPVILAQAVSYLAAAGLFWLSVRRYLASGWSAFAFAAPLLFAGVIGTLSNVGPDFLAAALVVASAAFLLWIADARPRWWALLPFGLAVFLSYQMRPAGMFLIGFWPLAGVLLLRSAGVSEPRRVARLGAILAATTLMPFLAFASLRSMVVGHFGLVSFTGINHAALAMSFLDRPMTHRLPDNLGPLARQVLKRREARGWRAMGPHDDPRIWFEQYSDNIWEIGRRTSAVAVERARGEVSVERAFRIEQDAQLGALAKEILIRRPGLYARWFYAAIGYGAEQLRNDSWIVAPFALLVLSLPFAVWRGEERARRPGGPDPSATERRARLLGLSLVGVAYFGVYLVLVSLVSFPFERYLTSMTLFLPGTLCGLLFEVWRPIAAGPAFLPPRAGNPPR